MPPVMPWNKFAVWIGMGDQLPEVKRWIETEEIPSIKINGQVMVNLIAFCEMLRKA